MKCEYCNRPIDPGDTVHGYKYGEIDQNHELFLPSRDSAWTIICNHCSEILYMLVYAKLTSPRSKSNR